MKNETEDVKTKSNSTPDSNWKKLNFNLKNEIFIFLPIPQTITNFLRIDKSSKFALSKSPFFEFVKENLPKDFLQSLSFVGITLSEVKECLNGYISDRDQLNEIILAFMLLKFSNKNEYQISFIREKEEVDFKLLSRFVKIKPTITSLAIDDMELLKNMDAIELLSEGLTDNQFLKEIKFTSNNLGDSSSSLEKLFESFSNLRNLKTLNLHGNMIGKSVQNLIALGKLLAVSENLEELDISFNEIGKEEEIKFTFVLNTFQNTIESEKKFILKNLNMDDNEIGKFDENLSALVKLLSHFEHLSHLKLNNNLIGENESDNCFVKDILINNKELTKLNLSNNKIGSVESHFDELLLEMKNHEKLNLIQIDFNPFCLNPENLKNYFEIINNSNFNKFSTFKKNVLELSRSMLGTDAQSLKIISDSLAKNKTIKSMFFSSNNIGDNLESIKSLSDLVKGNFPNIFYLDLKDNNICQMENSLEVFCEGLKCNTSLTYLNLTNNLIGKNANDVLYLSRFLEENKSLEHLRLTNNLIGENEEDFALFSKALVKNKKLKHLDLSQNRIGSHSHNFDHICLFIRENKTLISLEIRMYGIKFDSENIKLLQEAISLNNSLSKFSYRDFGEKEDTDEDKLIAKKLKDNLQRTKSK